MTVIVLCDQGISSPKLWNTDTRPGMAPLYALGIRQSRYFRRVKTKFQLYLAATVANLTLAAEAGLPGGTGEGSIADNSLRTKAIRSALDFVPARQGQAMSLALLASVSLPKFIPFISPHKAFRPDF